HDHVACLSEYARQRGQRTTAAAGRADLRDVADRIAQERHRVVVEGRYHHLTAGAWPARPTRIVEHLDQDHLGLHMVMLVLGALDRDVAHLRRRIDVGDIDAETLPT